jgi:integrase
MIPGPLNELLNKMKIRDYPANYYVFGSDREPGIKPTHKNQLYRRHRAILEKIGLWGKNIDMYSWKHTGVIALWNATQNMQLLKQQCRHKDLTSTIKYLRDLGLFTDYEQINQFPEI